MSGTAISIHGVGRVTVQHVAFESFNTLVVGITSDDGAHHEVTLFCDRRVECELLPDVDRS